jgi:hypothetical protein
VLDLSIKTHADHWRRSLKDVVQEVRRLLEHGVLNSEWQQCKRSLLGFYLQEANDCATNPEVRPRSPYLPIFFLLPSLSYL